MPASTPRKHLRLVHSASTSSTATIVEIDPDAPISPEVLDEVVATLSNLTRSSHLELALKVGEIVVTRLYGGDLQALRHRGRKEASFRKLAAHRRLPFSPSTLWRDVAIYELVQRMPGLAKTKHLGVAHLRAVVGLPQSVQERLLKAAETERWSKGRLEDRAAKHRRREEGKAGRRPLPVALRQLRQLDRLTRNGKEGAGTAGSATDGSVALDLGELDEERVQEIEKRLRRIRSWCEAVEKVVARRRQVGKEEEAEQGYEAAGE